jgi:hypothetical protein
MFAVNLFPFQSPRFCASRLGVDDGTRLSRKEAAHALTEIGYRITARTLAALASVTLRRPTFFLAKRTIYGAAISGVGKST